MPLPIWNKDKVLANHKNLPSPLRALIIGSSGSGKTIWLLNALLKYLDYDRLVVCSPSLVAQIEYQIIIKALQAGLSLSQIEQIFLKQNEIDDVFGFINQVAMINKSKNKIEVIVYTDPREMPEPENIAKENSKTLVVVDDCMLKHQNNIENLWVYGRPLGLSSIYLTQSYFAVDKQTVRGNSNVFVLFEVPTIDMNNSYYQIGSKDFQTCEDYKSYAQNAWNAVKDSRGQNRGYIVIDMTKGPGHRFSSNNFSF